MTKGKGKAKVSKKQTKVTPLEPSLTSDPQADEAVTKQGPDSGGEDSDDRDTDDYLRELRKLAAEFQEFKDRKKTGKRKFTVEEKSKSSSGDEDQSSPEFEEPDSSGPDYLPPSAKQSRTSTTMTTRKKARKDDDDDGNNQ
ncbi:hypothetical protein SARC_11944 [Sphaeroforma arctica JP610]|uniref:Uncharacterized protein n=1 Tax=Sphaeroforma arctica JP610 TaxID=667725 RepID=A0A0L0FFJ0_9EUKA|nr:hypothetical protein SARC_11944 [Sphaeroforma arctica JP610]KNC75534.1 hypothetical protein SARC_11944 [Sphaeroforma arctica JP610]|eukprot:XP_014149436.1 hypothetical protein SARC_11944 [Sphaeroforma arctica JP610]